MSKTAIVNKIIPFSNVDGPGNRTAIFFQSCPFRCLYCHNPETINLCVDCGECIPTCPTHALSKVNGKVVWDSSKCVDCDTCIKVCKHHSSPKVKTYDVQTLVAYIKEHALFISGITVSGGECMNYADFIYDLFVEVKKLGLTCLIDSNGAYDFKQYKPLLEISDGVMLDVKAVDEAFHQKLCRYSNKVVLENLEYLQSIGKLVEVRTVLLPEEDEQNTKTVDYVSKHLEASIPYKLLRYRPYGVRPEGVSVFGMKTVSEAEANAYKKIALMNRQGQVYVV
ncbi:pyruvate formate lyase activating enzyme [Breznakia blatticola]|uniref:Pyruvate formate lyase activating enzyme n=1 Tax=Breznakia blatticola TaxID=1754012 RepID=A0A4R8A5W0_9FIRM|nr:YjjW family glycine radical enzyme activase [Breznakia blatticola]TDW25772.1 pyruvate formate lyase activating enzyme [Breznakia blatticola]